MEAENRMMTDFSDAEADCATIGRVVRGPEGGLALIAQQIAKLRMTLIHIENFRRATK